MPEGKYYGKNTWNNCALILAEKKDSELEPYLYELIEWLEDFDYPGAECIFERLEKTDKEHSEKLKKDIEFAMREAEILGKNNWYKNLTLLYNQILQK